VDCVLTTREFAWVMKHMGIDFTSLPEEQPDSPLGESTGAAAIFGTTGGVTEAALRTAYWMVFDEDLPEDAIEFKQVRGLDGLRFRGGPVRRGDGADCACARAGRGEPRSSTASSAARTR
jgi:NADH-quinone oxidoreductase subunit G